MFKIIFLNSRDQTQASIFAVLALEQNSQESTYSNTFTDKFDDNVGYTHQLWSGKVKSLQSEVDTRLQNKGKRHAPFCKSQIKTALNFSHISSLNSFLSLDTFSTYKSCNNIHWSDTHANLRNIASIKIHKYNVQRNHISEHRNNSLVA